MENMEVIESTLEFTTQIKPMVWDTTKPVLIGNGSFEINGKLAKVEVIESGRRWFQVWKPKYSLRLTFRDASYESDSGVYRKANYGGINFN